MIRNPYAKRPRPATPEISCQPSSSQQQQPPPQQPLPSPADSNHPQHKLHYPGVHQQQVKRTTSTLPINDQTDNSSRPRPHRPSEAKYSSTSLPSTRTILSCRKQDDIHVGVAISSSQISDPHQQNNLPLSSVLGGSADNNNSVSTPDQQQNLLHSSSIPPRRDQQAQQPPCDPWDNCDIDWDAATQQLDQATSMYQQGTSTLLKTATTSTGGEPLTTGRTASVSSSLDQSILQPDAHFRFDRPITSIGIRRNTSPSLETKTTLASQSFEKTPCVEPRPPITAGLNRFTSKAAPHQQLNDRSHLDPTRPSSSSSDKSSDNQQSVSASNFMATNANAVASLRPPAWTSTACASASATSDSNNKTIHRPSSSDSARSETRIGQLPTALQYSPDQVQTVQDEYRDALVQNANLGAPLLNQWTLYPHQRKAILRALLMRRMILALDMGLGKTLIGCVWAKAFKATYNRLKIFVICPVSLLKEWKRTAQEATGLVVQDEKAKDYGDSLDLQICSWAKVPTQVPKAVDNFVVVCDEAHHIQSMNAARTKDTLQLVGMQRCVGVLLLTGTPMKNGKPCNLFPLLRAVRHPFGSNQKAFEIHFCAGHQKSFGPNRVVWDASGSSNLGVLREQVASHVMYMTKEQCLEDLPPQTRMFQHVPVSSRFQLQHNQSLNDLAKLYASSSSFQDNGTAILGAVQRVRMIASLAKIDATVGLAKEILQNEPAIVIFTSFQKVASSVRQKLQDAGWHGELLTGETPANKRQAMVDNFQNGLSPVFVCTFGAGGVGLTLTAACTVILLDRPWTPGDAHQAEDRVRRIGQTKPVTCIWMTAFDLDRQIDSLLEQKNKTSHTVLVDQNDENNDTKMSEAPKLSIFQMLKSILENRTQQNVPKESLSLR